MDISAFFLLHTGGSYPEGWLHSDWRPEPTIIVGVFALIAAYLWWTGPKNRDAEGREINPVSGRQRVAFVAGSLVMLIALNPPLDDWSDNYLLSAHMFQHMLLIFVTAPLWLVGMPAWLLRRLVAPRVINRTGYVITRPIIGFLIANALITLWHMPFMYESALASEPIHIIQHQSFLFAALISWWPVMGTLPEWPRLPLLMRCLYLFATTIPGGIVGAFVTLAEPGIYSTYIDSPRIWGLDLATDQEIAGLMMWVLASVIYLLIITVIFFQWASNEEAKDRRPANRMASAVPETAARLDSSTSSFSS